MLTHNHKHDYRPLLLPYLISMVPVSGCSMYLSNNIKVVVTYSDNFRNRALNTVVQHLYRTFGKWNRFSCIQDK